MRSSIDAFYSDPSYKLDNHLKNWFQLTTDIQPIAPIKFPTNSLLISLDVKSMFTTMPVNRTEELMADILMEKSIHPEIVGEFWDLLSIRLKYNISTNKNKKYEFPDGLLMEGPLSMIASEVFMNRLEMDILNTIADRQYICFWAK